MTKKSLACYHYQHWLHQVQMRFVTYLGDVKVLISDVLQVGLGRVKDGLNAEALEDVLQSLPGVLGLELGEDQFDLGVDRL